MIYPRLMLAKRLLSDEGLILISIDDAEQASLRRVCDQVFGEQNFVSQLVWEKGRKNDAKYFPPDMSTCHLRQGLGIPAGTR